jgi:hypothetical protein
MPGARTFIHRGAELLGKVEAIMVCECCGEDGPSVRDRNLTHANAAKIVSVSICNDCDEKIHKPALRDAQFRAWAKRKDYLN